MAVRSENDELIEARNLTTGTSCFMDCLGCPKLRKAW
jgi:hypothetical protein